MNQSNNETMPPLRTAIDYFYQWEKETPDKVFLRQPSGPVWKEITYREAGQEARRMATALYSLGLEKGDHIAIFSKNCAHWVITDLAILMGGFVSVPFYPTLTGEQLGQVLRKSNSRAIFVGKLDEWESRKPGVPAGVKIIQFPHYQGNAKINEDLKWENLASQNEPLQGQPLPILDELWTILFTSGTTGTPKGVMHNHRSAALLGRNEEKNHDLGVLKMEEPRFFSFLPLNHVAERIAVETACLLCNGSISFADSIDTFGKNLQDTQPTFFFAVPRIWTKFQLAILEKIPPRRFNLLMKLPIIGGLVKKKIRNGLGLHNCTSMLTGASLTPESLKQWYRKLGLNLREVYGSTETCGGICLMPAHEHRPNTVGRPVKEVEIKIDPTSGEVIAKVPWLMSGYYQEPELTAEVIRDGWLYTGDKGKFDEKGFLQIIGRVKDAFKTSKGEFVSPNAIEEKFADDECIEQVCVAGLGIPQPLALVNLSEIGKGMEKVALEERFLRMLNEINTTLASHERISTLVVIQEPWSEANNLLTPTLKVRRQALNDRFAEQFLIWQNGQGKVVWV